MLKHFYLIFVFCVSALFAQVKPPDLRCLEVLNPSGNVKLTWIPPPNLGNFHAYEIYSSVFKNGPYTLLTSSLNTFTTTSFVHTTATATLQSAYYYMVTKYGANGVNSSINSDTLRSIFLNAFQGIKTLDLKFPHLHTPKLPSSANVYTLLKEFPLGTWNNLSILNGTEYPDTINVCKDKMNYLVTLTDASGCSSISNLVVGTYTNSKAPEEPYVDSVSVLPNGQTIIAWKVPIDKDIDRYSIQYLIGVNNYSPIAILNGRNNTAYTYTTATGNSNSVGIFVQAVDSCGRGSTVNYDISTMFVQAVYDRCAYKTRLGWNRYRWSKVNGKEVESTLEYRIYYSVNGSGYTQVGHTEDTTFVHEGVSPGKNVCYFVRVINKGKNITASSNRTCLFSSITAAPAFIYIKTASITNKTSSLIKVYLDTLKTSTGILIQRSENDSIFATIGFVNYDGSAHYSFTDDKIESDLKSYYYRAVVVDSCGNNRNRSNISKTIFLKVNEDESQMFVKHLSWSPYSGFGGDVSGYNIYRIINDNLTNALIGSTDALTTSYTDNLEEVATQGAKIDYLVQAVEGIGNPYGIFEMSNSNAVPVYMEGRLFVPNAFAPGGVNTLWLPVTHFIEKTDYHVAVFNRWGKKVFETEDDTKGWNGENCIADVYVYLIDFKNARGEYQQVKGNVLLLR